MFQSKERRKLSPSQMWLLIFLIVAGLLFVIQVVRVNRPKGNEAPAAAPIVYTKSGPLVAGDVTIDPGEFQTYQINLNRRAKLSGSFQTGSVKKRVAISVIKESDLESWTSSTPGVQGLTETGYVPGGKISPVLEPGEYLLILDGRFNEESVTVATNFVIE